MASFRAKKVRKQLPVDWQDCGWAVALRRKPWKGETCGVRRFLLAPWSGQGGSRGVLEAIVTVPAKLRNCKVPLLRQP